MDTVPSAKRLFDECNGGVYARIVRCINASRRAHFFFFNNSWGCACPVSDTTVYHFVWSQSCSLVVTLLKHRYSATRRLARLLLVKVDLRVSLVRTSAVSYPFYLVQLYIDQLLHVWYCENFRE